MIKGRIRRGEELGREGDRLNHGAPSRVLIYEGVRRFLTEGETTAWSGCPAVRCDTDRVESKKHDD